ncbi:transmembrane emp24 domain-containing protein 2 [Drosophila grimshawi]|uniref:transmembrane emp24 domain-containing protein 2 n=1 Tax=Drosophila grimshawi TaxID=7222 RepID=UPI001C9327B3|nr:transmembrane emp24 domain-containing protein 2 [Drosophila grimshawi]
MFAFLMCFLTICRVVCGFLITVDSHETICFFDRAQEKDKVTISFEVMEGGFKDIAVHISGPNDDRLYEAESETSGKYTFAAINDGQYTLCFDNEKSTLTPKILMFHFIVVRDLTHYNDPHKRSDDVVEQSVLQANINELASLMTAIKYEQEYMHVRYKGHQEINDSAHFRIVAWSIFGPSLLLTMTLLEIYYLKRFFEVKCVV